ncbi:unnamed protein product [Meganyctiphanes norvegica]|uniref:Transmembrane protein n=1 Tax=Meganyctiphanes norvegica TaxID=48144 RepID=A0AAV2RGD7_MEGNR
MQYNGAGGSNFQSIIMHNAPEAELGYFFGMHILMTLMYFHAKSYIPCLYLIFIKKFKYLKIKAKFSDLNGYHSIILQVFYYMNQQKYYWVCSGQYNSASGVLCINLYTNNCRLLVIILLYIFREMFNYRHT